MKTSSLMFVHVLYSKNYTECVVFLIIDITTSHLIFFEFGVG